MAVVLVVAVAAVTVAAAQKAAQHLAAVPAEEEAVVVVPKILFGYHCQVQPPGSRRVVRTLGSAMVLQRDAAKGAVETLLGSEVGLLLVLPLPLLLRDPSVAVVVVVSTPTGVTTMTTKEQAALLLPAPGLAWRVAPLPWDWVVPAASVDGAYCAYADASRILLTEGGAASDRIVLIVSDDAIPKIIRCPHSNIKSDFKSKEWSHSDQLPSTAANPAGLHRPPRQSRHHVHPLPLSWPEHFSVASWC